MKDSDHQRLRKYIDPTISKYIQPKQPDYHLQHFKLYSVKQLLETQTRTDKEAK